MAKNAKGKEPDAEKFTEKSKTNSIQYFSTEQAVQNMLQAGMDKQIMAQNTMASHEIDKNDIENIGVETNDYRADKFSIIDNGRRANAKIRAEIENSHEAERRKRSEKNNL